MQYQESKPGRVGEAFTVDLAATTTARHRCRNPRCREKLRTPVENPRDAFCCRRCDEAYYRTHCRVCERPIIGRNSRRELCGRRQCRNQFRSARSQFFSVWYPTATGASKPGKSSTTSTLKSGTFSGRASAIGADSDREVLRQNAIDNRKFWNAAALIGSNDPPVNILGGYKFPNAPDIDLKSDRALADHSMTVTESRPDLKIPDDLSIPQFLCRGPA
jgi:hypothetical protein